MTKTAKAKKKSVLFRNRSIPRKLMLRVPLRVSRYLVKKNRPKAALANLRLTTRLYPRDARVLHVKAVAYEAMGDYETGAKIRTERLRHLMPAYMASKNFTEILKIMAEMERTHHAAQFQAGQLIAQQLVSETGRQRILRCALKARARFKESAYLSHLISLCQAMEGDYRKASKMLVSEINAPHEAPEKLLAKRVRILEQSWRVVDQIAREQMDWSDEASNSDQATPGLASKPVGKTKPTKPSASGSDEKDANNLISFKERALQGRQIKEYLGVCDDELKAAETLGKKLRAVEDMLRTGIRRIPDYTSSYRMAKARLKTLQPALDALFTADSTETLETATNTVLELCTYHSLAHRLRMPKEKARIIERLETISQDKAMAAALWPAPGAIAKDPDNAPIAKRIMERIEHVSPKINRDIQNYFQWAMATRSYSKADAFYKRLPKTLHRRQGLLYYVNILQRQSRFSEALKLLNDVHGQILANPSQLNAYSNHSLIKRTGELRFLIETNRIYKSVSQPENPKGVVLIAPRNIDQLRRYPLMVLLEFKRRGWAVVPLVEGLLPIELTGHPSIDVMNSAIGATTLLSDQARAVMPELTDFVSTPSKGTLRWGDIDLSHSVWEDAAINRRRYTINWKCPELQHYVTGLAGWTQILGRILYYANGQQKITGRKTACISLVNCRLPDSLFRFYCAEFGDAENFFYLHIANGYQNYFTNFSTNISQRAVLRNITKYPHVRSASFPVPEFFETYYNESGERIPEIMERFAAITKVKRSTEGNDERPKEALEVDKRIADWRAKGGKVVCAFGKVVCDSGVPFDGGPAHKSMKDWINHCIKTVQGTDTLLLIKPHPHELNNQIATFPTEYFKDLLTEPLGKNVILLGHRWFDMHDMESRMDIGLIYNGTTAVELGIMNIPCILAGRFAPIDYPVGHVVPKDRADFEAYLRFEKEAKVPKDLRERSAAWLDYMANEAFTQPYRYHARPVTNKVLYPPYWFKEDLDKHKGKQDPAVLELVGRALGERLEPGGTAATKKPAPKKTAANKDAAAKLQLPAVIEPSARTNSGWRAVSNLLSKVSKFFKRKNSK
ncbi:hypothetical protein [Profundibacter sp.]